jgi:hypothetical protein
MISATSGTICSVPLTSLSPFAVGDALAVDTSPPQTSVGVTPAANAAGWSKSSLVVTLTATDPDGTADVAEIDYSTIGAQSIPATVVPGAAATFTIAAEGATTASISARDRAGNIETPKVLTVQIDKTPPTVTYGGNAGTYTVDQMVSITCAAADPLNANGTSGSGLLSTTCQTVAAPAYSFGTGAHVLSASADDNAGNTGSGSTTFTVKVTCGSLCTLTRQFVESSPKFAALPPAVQQRVDLLATSACRHLDHARRALTPGEKARLIAAYGNLVQALARGGWLTPAQALTLIAMSQDL